MGMKKKIAAWLTIIKVKKCAKYITLNIIHITYSTKDNARTSNHAFRIFRN